METVRAEERRQLIDRVLHLSPKTYVYGGLGANVGLIYSDIERDYERVDWMKWDVQNIHRTALGNAQSGALCVNPRYAETFQTVFADPKFYRKSGSVANEEMILAEIINRGVSLDEANLSQVVNDLWDSLCDNPSAVADSEAQKRRLRQIAEMTANGGFTVQRANQKVRYDADGRKHDPNRGMSQGFSLAAKGPWSASQGKPFSEMSNEEVDALYQEWKVSDNYRNMSREELRAVVRKAGPTDVFGKNVRVPTVAAPDAQDRLHHPVSGEPFNQKSLIKFINQAAYNGRDLITRNGRIVPRLRDLFERTVRGELG